MPQELSFGRYDIVAIPIPDSLTNCKGMLHCFIFSTFQICAIKVQLDISPIVIIGFLKKRMIWQRMEYGISISQTFSDNISQLT